MNEAMTFFDHDSRPALCLNVQTMRPRLIVALFPLFMVLVAAGVAQNAPFPPPAILQVFRDQVKPGKMAEYARLEGEAAQACVRAGTWPYVTIQAITGPQEVWFVSGFDSYAAMEKSAEPFARNATLGAELNRIMEAKTPLVNDPHTVFLEYREDLGRNTGLVRAQTRFFNVTIVRVYPGHEKEFEDGQRIVRAVRERAGTADNRAVYQTVSGMASNTYMIFSPYHSFHEAGEALGPFGQDEDLDDSTRARLRDLRGVAVQNSETFVFAVNPPMSNPAGEWLVDDPEFWRSSAPLQRPAPPKKPDSPK
jgi:hypothetical protein